MTIYGLYDLEDNYIYSGNIHEMAKFIEQPEASLWCRENRTYKNLKRIEQAKSKENEEK